MKKTAKKTTKKLSPVAVALDRVRRELEQARRWHQAFVDQACTNAKGHTKTPHAWGAVHALGTALAIVAKVRKAMVRAALTIVALLLLIACGGGPFDVAGALDGAPDVVAQLDPVDGGDPRPDASPEYSPDASLVDGRDASPMDERDASPLEDRDASADPPDASPEASAADAPADAPDASSACPSDPGRCPFCVIGTACCTSANACACSTGLGACP